MKKIFEFVENQNGQIGFLEPNSPDEFTPGDSITIAHDCIEHFKGDDGSVDREFMAFGCMYYIRHEIGNYFNFVSVHQSFANEFASDVWKYYLNGSELKKFVKRKRYPEFVNKIAKTTEHMIKSEAISNEEEEVSENLITEFIEGLKYWMNEGYKKAKRRYRNPFFTFETFNQIVKEIENLKKRISSFDIGDRIEIKWNPNYCRVDLKYTSVYDQR